MNPGRQTRLASKTADRAIHLNKRLLGQIFRFRSVLDEAVANIDDLALMPFDELAKSISLAGAKRIE